MKFILIICLLSIIQHAASQTDIHVPVSGQLKPGTPVFSMLNINNTDYVIGSVTISLDVNIDEDVVVCIQEDPLPLPHFSKYKMACTYSIPFKANPIPTTTGKTTTSTTTGKTTTTGKLTTTGIASSTNPGHFFKRNVVDGGHGAVRVSQKRSFVSVDPIAFNPRSKNHLIGVYYAADSVNHKTFTVSFTIQGKYCSNKAGDDCKNDIVPFQKNSVISLFGTGYYSYNLKPVTSVNNTLSYLMVSFTPTDNKTVTVYARNNAIPSKTVYDAMGNTSVTIYSPSSGTWIITVVTTDNTNITINSNEQVCGNGTAGIGCSITLKNATALSQNYDSIKLVKANDIIVYSLTNMSYNSLYASLYDGGSAKDKNASIYASFNRVPLIRNGMVEAADFNGCNNEFCGPVQSISSKNATLTDNGTWYITIIAGRDADPISFWYNDICPGGCSGEGQCQTSYGNYGTCVCNTNFEDLMCKQSSMLIEYIILIIIAALVVISALLGLIAWVYMRRRTTYIEVR